MTTPLRGELTASNLLSEESDGTLHSSAGVQSIVSHLLRLTASQSYSSQRPGHSRSVSQSSKEVAAPGAIIPSISLDPSHSDPASSPSLSTKAREVTASWSLTDSDSYQTEQALLPYLIHIAASRNDVSTILFCISAAAPYQNKTPFEDSPSPSATAQESYFVSEGGAGVCNALDACCRSPLHTAALNGKLEAVRILLENGASVHLRDLLDHTALYYVSDR